MKLQDLQERVRDILSAAGLVVNEWDFSGEMVLCGTIQKPDGTDGRYKVHDDFPPTVGYVNYHGDGEWKNVPLYKKNELNAMTEAEKEAMRERIRREKEKNRIRRERAQSVAAERANREYSELPVAGAEHPYLKRKGVPAFEGVKRTRDGRLVVPITRKDGEITSLQYICGNGEKRYLKDGRKEGGFFPFPAKEGNEDGPLLIAEGYATAASVCMATGYAAVAAFDAGNLLHVARAMREKYSGREIVFCADNDLNGKKPDGTPYNTGQEKAKEAARAVGGKVAFCPSINGCPADFNDVFTRSEDGPERVRMIVERARTADEECPMPPGFKMVADGPRPGLYFIEEDRNGNIREKWIGPPIRVLGRTRDADNCSWGIFLEWKDPDGKTHTRAMPQSALSLDGWEWHAELVSGGWLGDPQYKRHMATFLARVNPSGRIRCVPRVGWHEGAFVLPDEAIGRTGEEKLVLQSESFSRAYGRRGDLEAWGGMAGKCAGNSRFALSLCASFAGSLLKPSGLESGGFNLVGRSSTGKSTAQKLAASVWDSSDSIPSWRTTDNGLEGLAALHNDAPLILDEMGQAPPKTIEAAAYMLGNGKGKARANRNGTARNPQEWRTMIISSGEVGLAAKLREAGIRAMPGQEVRLVDIEAEPEEGKGIVEDCHDFPDAASLIRHIHDVTRHNYGLAGRKYLEYVTAHLPEIERDIPEALQLFVQKYCPENADGQVKCVAMRFGLCVYAGLLAIKSGVLPWKENDVWDGILKCFRDWLKVRGTAGSAEDAAILGATRLFIEKNGSSRFQDVAAGENAVCINRAGFKRTYGGRTEYLILQETFAEVVAGHPVRRAASVLRLAGWLNAENGRNTTKRDLPGLGRVRCYAVTIPEDTEEKEEQTATS